MTPGKETEPRERSVERVEPKGEVLDLSPSWLSSEVLVRRRDLIRKAMGKVLVEGTHYGTIPGCGSAKVLYSAGADVLCNMFAFRPRYTVDSAQRNDSLIAYAVSCEIVHISGSVVGAGVGSCNTRERKYAQTIARQAERAPRGTTVSAWELDNTVYKMAAKRAKVDAVQNATGCRDLFDDEDLAQYRDGPEEGERAPQAAT